MLLSGSNGTAPPVSSRARGNIGMYTTGSCEAGYGAFAPGARLVYLLSLDAATPPGGTLTLSTCGLTTNNTVLYVGKGCPTWFGSFQCVRGNNNAGELVASQACATNAFASTLSITVSSSYTRFFVQVGEYAGAELVSGLSWSYRLASASPTASRSRAATATRTRSRSAVASKSRSRKAKRVV